ncbi:probable GH family 25 lysozyme 3 isoform X1 [Dermacentor albipictus]|uniref:probable GH family 25 lysozyme 3 isoform X1 n=1 Tax=Dermacentor albipictus TaxID=60249 RepID=UPI0031FDBEE5
MYTGRHLFTLLFYWIGAFYRTEAHYQSTLYCHRFIAPLIASVLSPCTFPCICLSPEGISAVIMLWEPDGTPCRVGHCKGGACLELRNFSRVRLHHHSRKEESNRVPIASSRDRNSSTSGITSVGSTSTAVIQEIATAERAGKLYVNRGKAIDTGVFPSSGGNVPERSMSRFRAKRAAKHRAKAQGGRKKSKLNVLPWFLRKRRNNSLVQATNNGKINDAQSLGGTSGSGGVGYTPSATGFASPNAYAGAGPGIKNGYGGHPLYGNGMGRRSRFSLPPGVGLILGMTALNAGIQIASEGAKAGIRSRANKAAGVSGSAINTGPTKSAVKSGGIDNLDSDNTVAGTSNRETDGEKGREGASAAGSDDVDRKPESNKGNEMNSRGNDQKAHVSPHGNAASTTYGSSTGSVSGSGDASGASTAATGANGTAATDGKACKIDASGSARSEEGTAAGTNRFNTRPGVSNANGSSSSNENGGVTVPGNSDDTKIIHKSGAELDPAKHPQTVTQIHVGRSTVSVTITSS